MPFPTVEEQLAVIRRGVEKIVPEEELAGKLQNSLDTGRPLRVKYGIDPTGIDVHLGHTVPLRKMRQFQELGHQAVIIIGNYTALVGDPSGRDETRARLTQEQVEANAQDYLQQVSKVIDLSNAVLVNENIDTNSVDFVNYCTDKIEDSCKRDRYFKERFDQKSRTFNAFIYRNGDWFSRMSFIEILDLFSKVTLRQLLTRDDFSKRFYDLNSSKATIYMHEMFYPVMQAWDSVMVRADIELGGTEQLFSFMLARHLQQHQLMDRQIGIMSPILVGTDGRLRMGKSLGNYIGISEEPYEMVTKLMQIPDEKEQEDGAMLPVMRQYFELLTDMSLNEVDRIIDENPKEAKLTLARTVTSDYHDSESADNAIDRWKREVSNKELPSEIPEILLDEQDIFPGGDPKLAGIATFAKKDKQGNPLVRACDLYFFAKLCKSKSEARRLIQQGGASIGENRTRIADPELEIPVKSGMLLWAGKKKVCRIKLIEE